MSQNAWRHRNEHGRLSAAPNEALMRGMEKNGEHYGPSLVQYWYAPAVRLAGPEGAGIEDQTKKEIKVPSSF